MNRDNRGRFIQIRQEAANIVDILMNIWRLTPLLFICVVVYYHYDIHEVFKKTLLQLICGKNLDQCICECKDNSKNGYWKS